MSGKSNTDRGKVTEQMAVRWLRDNGWPHAERTVRTGYRVTGREMADAGDVDGMPGVCVQIKSLRPANRAERAINEWMVETEKQRYRAEATIGLLIVRRDGTADVGDWWAFLRLDALVDLGRAYMHGYAPVRMLLADAVQLLRATGYGEPLERAA